MGAVVTKGGLIFVGGGDSTFYAFDAVTGRELWTFPIGRRTTATPMTYEVAGKQFVLIASGSGKDATLTAFSL
jgi:glucose dehydrogenase